MNLTALDRQVGPDALLVTIGTAAPVSTRAVGPVTIRHGRTGPTTRPSPASCSLTVDPAQLPALPRVGDQLLVELDADALLALDTVPDDLVALDQGAPTVWQGDGLPHATGTALTDQAGWLHGVTDVFRIDWTEAVPDDVGGGAAWFGGFYGGGPGITAAPGPLSMRCQVRTNRRQRLILWADCVDAGGGYLTPVVGSAVVEADRVVELHADGVAPAGTVRVELYAFGNYPDSFGSEQGPWQPGDFLEVAGLVAAPLARPVPALPWVREADVRRRFTGEVTDLRLVPSGKPGQLRSVLSVTAVSRRQRLARIAIGDEPWPAESDGARAGRILALGGAAGLPAWGGPDSSDPAGWLDQFLGTPIGVTITADPGGEAVRLTWDTGTAQPFGWRGFDGLVIGQTYTIRAEVQPHGVAVGSNALFVNTVEGPMAEPTADDRWQAVVSTFTYPGNGAPGSQGITVYAGHSGEHPPAGSYCLVRALQLYESDAPILGDVDPGTVTVLARDVDKQPALGLLDQLAADSGSELVELRDGRMEWHQSNRRDNVDPAVELAADDVLAGVEWAQAFGDVVNDVTVVYGPPIPGSDRASSRLVDAASIAEHGTVAVRLDTQLVDQVDADLLATLLVGRYAHATWRVASLTVDLTRTLTPAQAGALAAVEFGALIAVTGFPTLAPTSSARCWVEGWAETFTRAGWRLELAVSDYGLTGPPITWAELPPAGLTWADLPAGLSWLATSYWRPPDEYAAGRWLDLPTDTRWDDLDPATTWATYAP